MRGAVFALFLMLSALISGCGGTAEEEPQVYDGPISFDYRVPEPEPFVIVDPMGYEPEGEKLAIVDAPGEVTAFTLHRADTHEQVYEGTVVGGQAYFSEVERPGDYYIMVERFGRSETFPIKGNLMPQTRTKPGEELCDSLLEMAGVSMPETVDVERLKIISRRNQYSLEGFLMAVQYLDSEGEVDTELCTSLMSGIMREAGGISDRARSDRYRVAGGTQGASDMDVARDILRLSIVNYIIPNHEYDMVIADHYHYLNGRRPAPDAT